MNYEPKISAGAGVAQPLGCSTCYGSCTGYCKGGCYKGCYGDCAGSCKNGFLILLFGFGV